MPDTPEIIDNIVNAPEHLGHALAQSGMSKESVDLTALYAKLKVPETTGGDDIDQIALKAARGEEYHPDARKIALTAGQFAAAETAGRIAAHVIGNVPYQAASMVADVIGAAGEDIQNHKDAISLLAKNNVPGYVHDEKTINGQAVEYWVDASAAGTTPDDPNVKVYSSLPTSPVYGSEQKFRAQNYAALSATESSLTSQALEQVHEFGAKDGNNYKDMLHDVIDTKMTQYYAQDKNPDLSTALASQPEPEKPTPTQTAPILTASR